MTNKILIAACFSIFAISSFAADYSSLDVNKDGLISKDEASVSKKVSEQWDILDINKDGYLQKAELAALGNIQG